MSDHNHHDHFELETVTACPGCDSLDHGRVYGPDVSRCERCRLLFRNPRPTQASILHSYENGLTFDRWQQELDVRTFLWQKRLDLVLKHRTSGRLVDVGTGDGFFLNFTTKHFDSSATEIAAAGVAYGAENGHHVMHGGAEVVTDTSEKFDVVTLWHVLEHVPDPARLLRDLRGAMEPDGILAIAVPNEARDLLSTRARAMLQRRGRRRTDEIEPFGSLTFGEEIHLTHFTPRVLKQLVKRSGFRILEFGVDDVHVNRRRTAVWRYNVNRVVNAIARTHLDNAMYLVCTPDPGAD